MKYSHLCKAAAVDSSNDDRGVAAHHEAEAVALVAALHHQLDCPRHRPVMFRREYSNWTEWLKKILHPVLCKVGRCQTQLELGWCWK